MPVRLIPFVNGQFYHVYNRGVEKRPIFDNKRDYTRFLKTIIYYQLDGPKPKFSNFFKYKVFQPNPDKKIVEIICYCLMPNHFHFLIRQLKDGGISEFISKLVNSYTKYYNIKHDRVGHLFQGQFKAVLMESDEQLVHLSRYIHLNPISSFLVDNLNAYPWSSYSQYSSKINEKICNTEPILNFFKSTKDYERFVLDRVNYAQQLEQIKHKLLEEV